MSYRETRNLIEYLRILSFPRPVSVENFKKPNFPLVAEILHWIISRLDPNVNLPSNIGTEAERVAFIRTVTQYLTNRLNLRVNTEKLYSADGQAVAELMKAVSLLHEASQATITDENDVDDNLNENIIRAKLAEFKRTHQVTSAITSQGASLFDELTKEIELREHRSFVLTRDLNLAEVENGLKEAVRDLGDEMQTVRNNMDNISSDETSLENKIQKKTEDLDRARKRLQALKAVRPAYMDEYEKLEQELTNVYDEYVLKHRCLSFLEQQLEDFERSEVDQIKQREDNIRGMISLATEKTLDTSQPPSESSEDDASELPEKGAIAKRSNREQTRLVSGRPRVSAGGRKLADDSLDSDLDLEGEEEEGSDLDSEDELELIKLSKGKEKNGEQEKNSDDDF